MKTFINGIQKYKHRLATVALVFGFLVDIVTFRTIDLSWSQTILAVHLVIVAVSILILARPAGEKENWFSALRSWVPIAHQYSTGALLSAFLVLYSASGSLVQSWPFFALVAIAAIGNETLKLQKFRLPFQTSLFFLNLLLFFALATPIALNAIGAWTFLVGIVVAALAFSIFSRVGRLFARYAFRTHMISIRLGWTAVLGLMVFLYFTNLIPPIPLSLKEVSAHYEVSRLGNEYIALSESRQWFERFLDVDGETLHLTPGAPAYVFTAIFAPADFSENIVHRWQYFNEETEVWETKNTVRFPIVGGRRGGYRGYSFTENPTSGKWRVSVETVRGQVVGRTYINIERATEEVNVVRTQL